MCRPAQCPLPLYTTMWSCWQVEVRLGTIRLPQNTTTTILPQNTTTQTTIEYHHHQTTTEHHPHQISTEYHHHQASERPGWGELVTALQELCSDTLPGVYLQLPALQVLQHDPSPSPMVIVKAMSQPRVS